MSKKPDDWMPTYIRQYLGDTTHLTRDEHGGYLLLLFSYWLNGGPLDDDDKKLATMAHATPGEWRRSLRAVLAPYFMIRDGKWHNKRADEELARARKLVASKSAAGTEGAKKRWQKDDKDNGTAIADASQSQRQTDAPLPVTVPTETVSSEEIGSFNPTGSVGSVNQKGFERDTVTIPDERERLYRFRMSLAPALGPHALSILRAASDPDHAEHDESERVCKLAAANFKPKAKGWPLTWHQYDFDGEPIIPRDCDKRTRAA